MQHSGKNKQFCHLASVLPVTWPFRRVSKIRLAGLIWADKCFI
jgi:hypothetical protein